MYSPANLKCISDKGKSMHRISAKSMHRISTTLRIRRGQAE